MNDTQQHNNFVEARELALAVMQQTDAMGYPKFSNAGSFAIMCIETNEGADVFNKTQVTQCCAVYENYIRWNGLTYRFTFDYGH